MPTTGGVRHHVGEDVPPAVGMSSSSAAAAAAAAAMPSASSAWPPAAPTPRRASAVGLPTNLLSSMNSMSRDRSMPDLRQALLPPKSTTSSSHVHGNHHPNNLSPPPRPPSPFVERLHRQFGNRSFAWPAFLKREHARGAQFATDVSRRKVIDDMTGKLNVHRTGFPKRMLYMQDIFHTLVNLPNYVFTLIFFIMYFLLFAIFAVPYLYQAHPLRGGCIPGVSNFLDALWFSVQTSMTIGYGGDMVPDPACILTNVLITIQSVASLLVGYSMLGLVYTRFSAPFNRTQTIVFSANMVIHELDGVICLIFRIGNVRKHQIIEASVRVLAAMNDPRTPDEESVFLFHHLQVLGGERLFLGLPVSVPHPITPESPLYGLSLHDMEQLDLEVLCLLEGIDASTSASIQACHSYLPEEICYNYQFVNIVSRGPDGRRVVDFARFDDILPVADDCIPSRNPHDL